MKWWYFLGGIASVLLAAAVLFPVFAKPHVDGPSDRYLARIARAIDQAHSRSGRWPTTFEDIAVEVGRDRPRESIRISFFPLNLSGKTAEYVIAANGRMRKFRSSGGPLMMDLGPIAYGIVPARND